MNNDNFINSECIHLKMSKKHRCPNCKTEYHSHRTGEYYLPLNSIYIRKGSAGQRWVKLPFGYCNNCKEIHPIKEEI